MRIVLYLMGREVVAVEFSDGWEGGDECDDEGEPGGYSGHSCTAAHIERDMEPLSPDDRWDWGEEWKKRNRGFGFR